MGSFAGAFLLLLLCILFISSLVFVRKPVGLVPSAGQEKELKFGEIVLAAVLVSYVSYIAFFSSAQWIWSLNPKVRPEDICGTVREFIGQRDGIETFVLYLAQFANVAISLLFAGLLPLLRKKPLAYRWTVISLSLLFFLYFFSAGFFPPMPETATDLSVPVIVVITGVGLYAIYGGMAGLARVVTLLCCAFAGLISVGPEFMRDLSFILHPGLKLLHGFKFSDIYFQYDLLLSLLAAVFLKFHIALGWFAYLGQFSYFLLLVALFLFADTFFKSKGLSVMFAIGLILVRCYARLPEDVVSFQVSPLRLDLWVVLLLLAYRKGVYHWSVGVAMAVLVVLHRNLGVIYVCSYVELLVLLFVLEVAGDMRSFITILLQHIKQSIVNILLIAASVGLCLLLFHELFSESAVIYRRLGIGMLPVARNSFYWYVPVMVSTTFILAVFFRKKFDARYMAITLFILLLAAGNLMYFFGRSHENNILNISAALVLVFFLLCDMVLHIFADDKVEVRIGRTAMVANKYILLPIAFLFTTGFYYGGKIQRNISQQFTNAVNGQIARSLQHDISYDMPVVRSLTHNSSKVYFYDVNSDFYYYYYGGYTPIGYYSPCSAWIYKKELLKFLQDLLDDQYYIVFNEPLSQEYKDIMAALEYYDKTGSKRLTIISKRTGIKDDVGYIWPQGKSLLHEMQVPHPKDYKGIHLGENFSIELLLKPFGEQEADAMIMNNIANVNGSIRGLSLQLNGNNVEDKYSFCFGNGSSSIPRVGFELQKNAWHYVVILVNRRQIRVYDNGLLLGTVETGDLPYANSDIPIAIGSEPNRQHRFKGPIREIKITDGNINDSVMAANFQRVKEVFSTK